MGMEVAAGMGASFAPALDGPCVARAMRAAVGCPPSAAVAAVVVDGRRLPGLTILGNP